MGTRRDAIPLLVEQHRQIADLFRRTLDATGEQRRRCFVDLERLVVAHETAEEVLVHPRLRRLRQDGDAVVTARLEEETRLKAQLRALERLDSSSPEFTEGLAAARALAQAHNAAEEAEEFPVIGDAFDDRQRARLRRQVKTIERIAPTRPHPGLALGGEHLLGGGLTAVADRARDLITRRGRRR